MLRPAPSLFIHREARALQAAGTDVLRDPDTGLAFFQTLVSGLTNATKRSIYAIYEAVGSLVRPEWFYPAREACHIERDCNGSEA
jgi:hypothetical protein